MSGVNSRIPGPTKINVGPCRDFCQFFLSFQEIPSWHSFFCGLSHVTSCTVISNHFQCMTQLLMQERDATSYQRCPWCRSLIIGGLQWPEIRTVQVQYKYTDNSVKCTYAKSATRTTHVVKYNSISRIGPALISTVSWWVTDETDDETIVTVCILLSLNPEDSNKITRLFSIQICRVQYMLGSWGSGLQSKRKITWKVAVCIG